MLQITIFLIFLALVACEQPSLQDNRDGKKYKTVKIGSQIWMAENLNYNAKGSKCYGEGGTFAVYDDQLNRLGKVTLSAAELQANCEKYGRLYDWETAQTACPSGWHLPSKKEWQKLVDFAGGADSAGTKLKARSGWKDSKDKAADNGTDEFGFSALLGGEGFSEKRKAVYSKHLEDEELDEFSKIDAYGFWWSSSEYFDDDAYSLYMRCYYNIAYGMYDYKMELYSIRCLQD